MLFRSSRLLRRNVFTGVVNLGRDGRYLGQGYYYGSNGLLDVTSDVSTEN